MLTSMRRLLPFLNRYILRLELLLLIGETSFLLSLKLIGLIVKTRFHKYLPGQDAPVAIEISFLSGYIPYIG